MLHRYGTPKGRLDAQVSSTKISDKGKSDPKKGNDSHRQSKPTDGPSSKSGKTEDEEDEKDEKKKKKGFLAKLLSPS